MSFEELQVMVEEIDGERVVRAPSVGLWSRQPRPGCALVPGAAIGRLRRLNRTRLLVLPPDVGGRVTGPTRGRVAAVEYGEALFRLSEIEAIVEPVESMTGANSDELEDTLAVIAPTDGVFYRRPAPDAAAFVELGQRLRVGQPVGLVEVMKTFNQIAYGGPGLPDEAEVVRICCEDAEEVSAGQPLILVR